MSRGAWVSGPVWGIVVLVKVILQDIFIFNLSKLVLGLVDS